MYNGVKERILTCVLHLNCVGKRDYNKGLCKAQESDYEDVIEIKNTFGTYLRIRLLNGHSENPKHDEVVTA